jgi:hypothetical protein
MRFLFTVLLLLAFVLVVPLTAAAGQCDGSAAADAKSISYSFPAGLTVDVKAVSFEASITDWGSRACVRGQADMLGLLRLIPWVRDLLPAPPELGGSAVTMRIPREPMRPYPAGPFEPFALNHYHGPAFSHGVLSEMRSERAT